MKETGYAHPSNLPALVPIDAFPTTALIHPDTWAVQEHLVATVADDGFPTDVVATYAETMLRLWSLDGQPTAAAVLPHGPGQSSRRRLPLSARLLRFLLADTAFREHLVDLLPLAIRLIRCLSTALRAPALTETFPVLLRSPEPGMNDLFRFHWAIHPLRIYNRIGARVHRYLVRELDAGKSIGRVLTPITRISQAFPADRPPRPVYLLDHNEIATRSLYKQVKEVVADLPNLFAPAQRLAPDSTQPKYVHQFMVSLSIAGFSFQGESIILTPGSRAPAPSVDELDTDPPEDPDEPFAAYDTHARREAEEEGILIEEPLSDDPAELMQAPDLEGLHPADALRRRTYVRQRATMHHDLPSDDWASLTLVDIALGYRALLEGANRVSDLGLAQMADLFLYHLLVVTGRPWQWLLSARMGTLPEMDGDDPQPALDPGHSIFDSQHFAFFFTPAVYPALGKRIRPPESGAGGEVDQQKLERWRKRWREHVRIYDEVSLVRALPLDPTARLLAAVYLDRRRQTIQAGLIDDNLPPTVESGPLLVTRDEAGPVRPYNARDAAALIDQVNAYRRSVRPDAPPVTRPRMRRATVSRLATGGMDRIAVHTLTGRHLTGLRAPLFYTLISSERLATNYHEAVDGLCAALGRAYSRIRTADDTPYLPWETGKPPKPKETCPAWYYGAVYHPRQEHIRAVVQALLNNARHPPAAGVDDPPALERARHDALTVLACYLLTLFGGFRVGEVAGMRRAQIDLFGSGSTSLAMVIPGLIVAAGKSDRFYEEYRIVPAAPPLTPLLDHVLARSAQASGFDGPGDPAFWFYRSLPQPISARRRHLWDYLDGIAHAAGLKEGAPRWHSARHFLRTFLYDRGMDEREIDYVLGHQAEGNEVGNPFRPSDMATIFAAYQEAAVALADVLELDFDGLW